MLHSALELEPHAIVETDVLVIGSGPAGLACALRLERAGRQCVLLETGEAGFSPAHQSVGELDSSFVFGDFQARETDERRQIGGKANAWHIQTDAGGNGVRLIPYAAGNFAARRAMGNVAWPIGRDQLRPYYAEAERFFAIAGEPWQMSGQDEGPWPAPDPAIRVMRYRFSDGEVLRRRVREQVAPSRCIRLLSNATALRLALTHDGNSVDHVYCESEPGRPFSIRARQVIASGGALATTALMLRSDDVHPAGVGNGNDLVGRYFMDHPMVDGGQLLVRDRGLFDRLSAFDLRREASGLSMAHLQLDDALIEREPIANINALLYPRRHLRNLSQAHQDGRRRAQRAWTRLRDARTGLAGKAASAATMALHARHLLEYRTIRKDEYDAQINRGGWSRTPGASGRYRAFKVYHLCEQAPHRDNRVLLGRELDRFGQRRVSIQWLWRPADSEAVGRAQDLYGLAFQRAGWGDYQMLRDRGEPEIVRSSLGHHIGTLRMHEDPRMGVTTGEGRVHGVANLFVAGSALFPTGGWENPTLTVVAMALRTVDCMNRVHGRVRHALETSSRSLDVST